MVEDNCQTSNCNLLSKSVESSIKIDSISIDLISANGKTGTEKCEHFSIRGFVSEVRKKDWNMCWPFDSDGNNNQHEEQSCVLPPLHVPRFKFWRCQNCRQEFDANWITNNHGPESKSCTSGLNSNSICAHASVSGDAIRMLSTYQQAPKSDILGGEKVDASASANAIQITEFQPFLCMDMKERSRNGVSSPTKGHGMRSKAKRSQEIDILATVAMEIISSPNQKACSTDDKGTEPKHHEVITLCNGSGPTEVADAKFAEKQNCFKSTAKICGTKKDGSADQRCKELTADVTFEEARDVEGDPIAIERSFMEGQPSIGLDACDDASSESAEVMAGNVFEDFSNDDSCGLQNRRKTRKVRLLTELLCGNGDGISNKPRNQDSLPNDITDASAVIDKPPVPDGQTGHFKRVLGLSRRRKPPQDEEWRPIRMSVPNKVRKNGRSLKRDVEDTVAAASTEALEIAFARMNLHSGKKSHFSIDRVDRSSGKGKKQKTLNCDEGLPSASSPENGLNKTGDKTGDASKVNSLNSDTFDSVNNTCRTREMDLFPLPAQRLEEKHNYSKMKFKMPGVHNQQDSQIFWDDGMPKEGSMGRKDVDVSRAGSVIHPFHLAPDASLDKTLNLSLNSYMVTQKFDLRCNPDLQDGRKSSLTWQGGPSKDQAMRENPEVNYTENFRNAPRPAPIASVGGGSVLNSKRPAYGMPFLNEKQNFSSQFTIGCCSPMQQKDFCSTSSKGKSTGIQDSTMLLKGGIHLAGKGSEQVAIDDIPMEIVELMAKNQYERCLPDSEYNKRQLESGNSNRSNQMIDFSKGHGHGELTLFKQEAAQKQIYHIRTGRNGVIERLANAGPTIQNPIDYFTQADRNKPMGQQEQAHNPVGFRPFLEHREKPSSGVQHSLSSSPRKNSAQSGKWIGDNQGKMSSQTSYPIAGSCNTCQGFQQQSKESKKLWSPLMPNEMSFVFDIAQNVGASSTNIDFLTCFSEGLHKDNANVNHDLKFLCQNASNLGKQNRSLGSETLGGTRVDYPFSCRQKGLEVNKKPVDSMDLYSNETIPAMHLLSLMDAGRLRSSTPVNMDANQKFLKRPPVAPSRTDSGAYRTFNIMKLPPYAKSQVADSHKPIPGITKTFGVSSSSFQHDRSFKRVSNFTSQASQVKEKRKGPVLCMPNNFPKLQESASTVAPFGTNCGSTPVHTMQNMFSAASDPKVFPSHVHPLHNLRHKSDVPSAIVHVNHCKNSLKTEVCTVNRNPADFNIPEAGNVYMIAGEDLKFGKLVPLVKGTGIIKKTRKRRPSVPSTVKERDITKPGRKRRPRVLPPGNEQG